MVLYYIICCSYFHDAVKTLTRLGIGKVFTERQKEEGVIFQENVPTVIIQDFKIYYKDLIVYA